MASENANAMSSNAGHYGTRDKVLTTSVRSYFARIADMQCSVTVQP
jgi:hypothetical protein